LFRNGPFSFFIIFIIFIILLMISLKDVEHIAKLARLELKKEELEKMKGELSLILDYFEIIQKADISKTEPFFYLQEQKNITRQDETKPYQEAEKIIGQAPNKEGKYLKVKEVL